MPGEAAPGACTYIAMRIDHVNTLTTGGAAIAALRLHESLLEAGVESRFCYQPPRRERQRRAAATEKSAGSEGLHWAKPTCSLTGRLKQVARRRWQKIRLKHALRGRPPGLEIFTLPMQEAATPVDFADRRTDILHLHWISGFIDYPSFFAKVDSQLPIVWTLHDMNPLTGGCHYANACAQYKESCRNCPQVSPRNAATFAHRSWQVKHEALQGTNLHLVAPSRWMQQCAENSSLGQLARSVTTIPHGLNLEDFRPLEKHSAKARWGLPAEAITVGCGAASLRNPRKGFQDILTALSRLQTKRKIHLVCVGEVASGISLPEHVRLCALGTLKDSESLAWAYSAMDVLAQPSRAESFGLVSAEAMACGVPLVAYNATAMPEYVLPGQTGLLSEVGDVAGFTDDLQWMLDHQDGRRRMGQAARRFAEQHFDRRDQADRHLQLYRTVLSETASLRAA